MRSVAMRLAMAGLATKSLLQKRVAMCLLVGVQNSILINNMRLLGMLDILCETISTSGDTLRELRRLDEEMGDQVPGFVFLNVALVRSLALTRDSPSPAILRSCVRGIRFTGLIDLVQAAKWQMSHGFLYLAFIRGLLTIICGIVIAMAVNPYSPDQMWDSFIESLQRPEVGEKDRGPPYIFSLPFPSLWSNKIFILCERLQRNCSRSSRLATASGSSRGCVCSTASTACSTSSIGSGRWNS